MARRCDRCGQDLSLLSDYDVVVWDDVPNAPATYAHIDEGPCFEHLRNLLAAERARAERAEAEVVVERAAHRDCSAMLDGEISRGFALERKLLAVHGAFDIDELSRLTPSQIKAVTDCGVREEYLDWRSQQTRIARLEAVAEAAREWTAVEPPCNCGELAPGPCCVSCERERELRAALAALDGGE